MTGPRPGRPAQIVALVRRVLDEQASEQVGLAASGAAFWLVITVMPTAIAAVSLYGLVVSPARVARNLSGLAANGPQSLGATLAQQLQKVAAANRAGLTTGLVVSLVVALWSASAGIYNLERAIRGAYRLRPEEYVRARGRALVGAIVVVLSVGLLALVSTAVVIAVEYLPVVVAAVIAVPVIIAVLAAIIAGSYRYSCGHRLPWRAQLPGALAASVGLGLVVGAFVIYLRVSTRYTAVYGALAGSVIGMIGTYLVVYVVLLGAVLNAELARTNPPNRRARK